MSAAVGPGAVQDFVNPIALFEDGQLLAVAGEHRAAINADHRRVVLWPAFETDLADLVSAPLTAGEVAVTMLTHELLDGAMDALRPGHQTASFLRPSVSASTSAIQGPSTNVVARPLGSLSKTIWESATTSVQPV